MRKALFIIFTLIFLLAVVTDFAVSQGTTIEIRKDKVVSQGIAVEILKNKAEQGNIRAQYDLGVRYDRGQGVVRDYSEAAKWFRMAAEQGDPKAQRLLGWLYDKGQGVQQDLEEAAKWWRMAAEKGDKYAQNALGRYYIERFGYEDYEEATKWLRMAAEQGFGPAQGTLGRLYGKGSGVSQDYVSAYMWFSLAEKNGHKKASQYRGEMAKKMTPQQITQAQKLTRRWTPNKKNKANIFVNTSGTGFSFGSSSYILTNYHVVKDAKLIKVKYLNGNSIKAEVVVKDESNDIAFLKPESSPKLPGANISLGDSSEMRIGDKVFTIGFPMSNILGQQPRYSEGVINSLVGLGDDPKVFQVSIPIQKGNSGGPLFNQKGEVVGVVSSSLDAANTFQVFGNSPQNVNFAIKSTFVKNLVPMIPEMLLSPTDIVVVPKGSDSLSGFIDRVRNNIVLIEAEY